MLLTANATAANYRHERLSSSSTFSDLQNIQQHQLWRVVCFCLQEMLGIPLLGAIPEDQQVIISTNRGEPLVLQKKLSLSGIAFENAARRLIGKQDYFVDVQVRSLQLASAGHSKVQQRCTMVPGACPNLPVQLVHAAHLISQQPTGPTEHIDTAALRLRCCSCWSAGTIQGSVPEDW
jgi:hypothetical protein